MFDSEFTRFTWLLDTVEVRLRDAVVNSITEENLHAFLVTSCWMEAIVTQAKAVRSLILADMRGGIPPIARALWELWITWRYFFDQDNRRRAALKVLMSAQMEALEFAESRPHEFSEASLQRSRRALEEWRSADPIAFEEIVTQRRKRRFHWSGQTYSALEKKVFPYPGVYKTLSWETHCVLAPIRDVRIDLNEGEARMEFGRSEDDPFTEIDHLAYSNGGILFFTFSDYAHAWGLEAIKMRKDSSA